MDAWYLSQVVGTGTMTDPYRSVVQDQLVGQAGAACSNVIGSRGDGSPTKTACLVHVDADDHSRLLADDRVIPLPTVLTDRWAVFPIGAQLRIAAWLTLHRLTLDVTDNPTVQDVIDRLGGQMMDTFRARQTRGRR